MQIKAIDTVYGGCRFRSRLEARTAVFLDCLGIKWDYEFEGYDLDGIWYLPDFWLPEMSCWLEVKGTAPTDNERKLCYQLSTGLKQAVFLQSGSFGMDRLFPADGRYWCPTNTLEVFAGECWDMWTTPAWRPFFWEHTFSDGGLPEFLQEKFPDQSVPLGDTPAHRKELVLLDRAYFLEEYGRQHERWIMGRGEGWKTTLIWSLSQNGLLTAGHGYTLPPKILSAYTAARQARFEHSAIPA